MKKKLILVGILVFVQSCFSEDGSGGENPYVPTSNLENSIINLVHKYEEIENKGFLALMELYKRFLAERNRLELMLSGNECSDSEKVAAKERLALVSDAMCELKGKISEYVGFSESANMRCVKKAARLLDLLIKEKSIQEK